MLSRNNIGTVRISSLRDIAVNPLKSFSTTRRVRKDLKSTLKEAIPEKVEAFKYVKLNLGDKSFGDLKVSTILGGMRGNRSMLWEASTLDPNEGIRFHGLTIKDCQKKLQKSQAEADSPLSEMLPESMFWFLLTGKLPLQEQINDFTAQLAENAELPGYLHTLLDSLPSTLHPMTQMSIAISALNHDSLFAKAYERGIPKTEMWEYVFDDVINLVAKLPAIAGKIYQNTFYEGYMRSKSLQTLGEINKKKDISYNLASLLGMTKNDSVNLKGLSETDSSDFVNLIRLYCALHADHEGGNVSAHATHLVGSALSDPYLSYSAGIQGLAGPLHGLAAQEVLRFIVGMKESLVKGLEMPSDEQISAYLWDILNSGRVIPGYGHAVLRRPDPRFEAMIDFGLARPSISESDVHFKLVHQLSKVAPGVLKEHGKTQNPYPNVDSSSGVLFYHYGITQTMYFTVIFGVSRALGPLAQLVWDRILGLPIERPKSVNLQTITNAFGK